MADIFVSYASEDRDRVRPLVEAFEAEGLTVWWDTRIDLGSSFDREIERQLNDAACVVVVWSKASIDSDWVREEAADGLERGILLPVLIDDCRSPLGFRRAQTASLISWPDERAEIKQVINRVKELVGHSRPALEPVMETRYAKSGDLSIAYQVIGDGPRDLIYVPGIVSHVEFFHQLPGYTDFLQGLAKFARVIVFDKRGNGLSDRISGAPSVAERMEDVTAVMDAVDSKRAVLFAVSEGGPISLLFAATYPDRVEGIVLYETFVRYGGVPGHTWVWEADAHKRFTEQWMPNYGNGISIAGFGASVAKDSQVRSLWGQAERMSNSPGGFRQVYEALLDTDVHAALPSVQAPCLVIYGKDHAPVDFGDGDSTKRDEIEVGPGNWFEEHAIYLAEYLPDARLVGIKGVDHFPWFANGDKIVAEVETFVVGAATNILTDHILSTLLFIGIAKQVGDTAQDRWREIEEDYVDFIVDYADRLRGVRVPIDASGLSDNIVFLRFDSPARAVQCANLICAELQDVGIQAGIHTGEIELSGDAVNGPAVTIGQSVMCAAGPNEVLVSRTVRDLVIGSEVTFEQRGTQELPGVSDSLEVFAVNLVSA